MERNLLLDDRLYPVGEPPVLRGKYRGRKKRIFVHVSPTAGITRKVETKRGWHRAVIMVGEHVYYESKATRCYESALALAQSLQVRINR
jgi:hypothetical protein